MHIPRFVLLFICCGHLVYFYLLAVVSNAPVPPGLQLSGFLLSLLWRVNPHKVLLGHMVILCLVFGGTVTLLSTAAAPFYIPISSAWGFQFLHIPTNSCFLCFTLSNIILMGTKWYVIVVAHVFLLQNDIPLYGRTVVYLPVPLLQHILVASRSWQLWIKLVNVV